MTPTIQRIAVLECLEKTKKHPTADQVLVAVRKKFPSVSRATVYNTLEALTQAGLILRITVDPAVARYDADLGPHAHFRCRVCNVIYDIDVEDENTLGEQIEGHQIETVRMYAYGVCEKCLKKDRKGSAETSDSEKPSKQQKTLEASSATSLPGSSRRKGGESRA